MIEPLADPTYAIEYGWPMYYIVKETLVRQHSYVAENGHRYGVDRDYTRTEYLNNLDAVEEGEPMFIDLDEGVYLETFHTEQEAEAALTDVLLLVSPEVD